MISRTTPRFRKALRSLSSRTRRQAREAYRLFQQEPFHPSLHFRQVHPTRPLYSARIGRSYRALGIRDSDTIIWFWIGSHDEYERIISQGG